MKLFGVVRAFVFFVAGLFALASSSALAQATATAEKQSTEKQSTEKQNGEKQAASPLDMPEADADLPGAGPVRRADWFRTTWRNRRNTFAERADRDREAVVFFGDSITQGWD